jgi:glycosyltransferase involved in cell wall biosynthesis
VTAKVLFLMPRFGDGGGERAWLNLLARLDRSRFEPLLAFLELEQGSHFLAEIPPDVRVHDLGKRRRLFLELPRMLLRLRRLLAAERPDVALSMLHTWGFLLDAARRLARIPMPIVVNEHIHVGSSLRHLRSQRPFLSRVAPLLHRTAYRSAARVVAVSEFQASELRDAFGVPPERVVVVPNGVDRERVVALGQAEPDEDAWLTVPPLVVAVGRLIAQKGFDDLLRAFALVADRRPARLAVLGEGELRADLERLRDKLGLDERVRFLGRKANPFPVMSRADVFVLSSRWEALPQVLVEALALGTPVVSTDCPSGPAELLGEGAYGVLVPPGDPDRLAEAILRVLEDDELRQQLAAVGPVRAADYDVDLMTRRYEAELERALRT